MRVGGIISFQIDGEIQNAEGDFEYGLGTPKREMKAGADRVHGYTEEPQPAFIDGRIRDSSLIDLAALFNSTSATITLALGNGKVIGLVEAAYVGDGTASTAEGLIPIRFESAQPGQESN